jgi:hypothetical protein
MQQFCKHDTAVTNKGTIQDGVQYSVNLDVIKWRLQTVQVQFTPVHNKEFHSIQKIEVKICLSGRAVQNTEIRR